MKNVRCAICIRLCRAGYVGVLLLLAAFGTGCLQLDTSIELHADGSGTVTERLGFSRRLIEMAENTPGPNELRQILTRPAALKRMERMGKGIRLVKHETRESAKGGLESVSVFKIDYLGDLIYVSPFVNAAPGIKELKVSLGTRLEYRGYERLPSDSKLKVTFHETNPRAQKKSAPEQGGDAYSPPPDTPRGLQLYRTLAPVFADIMDGLLVRVTFKSYAPIDGGYNKRVPLRNADAHPLTADIIYFTSENLDRHGERFLENEEVMLALLRGQHVFADYKSPRYSGFLAANLRHRESNHTLPLIHNTTAAKFDIKPSRALFDRFLAGKSFRWGGRGSRGANSEVQTRPAKFSEVGWQPE